MSGYLPIVLFLLIAGALGVIVMFAGAIVRPKKYEKLSLVFMSAVCLYSTRTESV